MPKLSENLPFGNNIIQRDLDSERITGAITSDDKRKRAQIDALRKLTGHYGSDSFQNVMPADEEEVQ